MKSEALYRDAVIVGSGPAGCAAAVALHRISPELASRVTVLEALRHPREKVCAGGVNGRAWKVLGELGMKVDPPSFPIDKTFIRTASFEKLLETPGVSRVVRRDLFDEQLELGVAETGIDFRQGVRVGRAYREGGGIRLVTSEGDILCKAVVGADGVKSVVRRGLFGEDDGGVFVLGIAAVPAEGHFTHSEGAFVLDFRRVEEGIPGYRWVFPFIDGEKQWVNAGIYEWRRRPITVIKEELERFMASEGLETAGARFRFFPERQFDPAGPFCAPGVLLAGEAAGVDPLLGEGISFALEYGVMAARSLAEALRAGDYSFRGHLGRIKRSDLGRSLMLARWGARLFYGRWHSAVSRAGLNDEKLVRLAADLLAGRRDASIGLIAGIIFRLAAGFVR